MGISRDKLHKRRATGGRRKILRGKRKYELGRAPALTKLGEKRIHLIRTRGGHTKYRALRLNEGHFVWPGEAATKRSRILNVVYNATSNELVRTNTLVKGAIVQIDGTPFRQWYEQFYRVQLGKKKEEVKEEDTKGKKQPEKKKEEKKSDKPADSSQVEAKKGEPKKSEKKSEKKSVKAEKKSTKQEGEKKKEEKKEGKKEEKKDEKKTGDVKDAKAAKKVADKARKQRRMKAMEIKKAIESGVRKPSKSLRRKLNQRNKSRIIEQALKDQFNTGRILARISSRPGQSGRADGYILEGDELSFYLRKIEKKKKE